jgi:acetylglutamate kinase
VVSVDPSRLRELLAAGLVPVLYPICALGEGRLVNVNADTAAAHVAASFGAEQLVLVTDVPGLMREFGNLDTIIDVLRTSEIDGLVREGVLGEGMIPKVEACRFAVEHGVKVVHMIDANARGAIADQLKGTKLAGTRVVSG